MQEEQDQEIVELVKQMVLDVQEDEVQNILRGKLEVITDPTPEQKADYTQPLQQYRLVKLKIALSNQRAVLLKKDYLERSAEIIQLEDYSFDHAKWMQKYRKLKGKFRLEKAVYTPLRNINSRYGAEYNSVPKSPERDKSAHEAADSSDFQQYLDN